MHPHGEYLGLTAQCEPAPDHFNFGLIAFLAFKSRYLPLLPSPLSVPWA